MPFFTPPVRALVPTTLPGRHPGNALFRYYGPRRRGVNVFVYGSTVTETELDGVVPTHLYHGGHIHTITDAEASLLTGAGYGANVTTDASVYDTAQYNLAVYG